MTVFEFLNYKLFLRLSFLGGSVILSTDFLTSKLFHQLHIVYESFRQI